MSLTNLFNKTKEMLVDGHVPWKPMYISISLSSIIWTPSQYVLGGCTVFSLGQANNLVYFCLWTKTADICLRQIQYILLILESLQETIFHIVKICTKILALIFIGNTFS